MEFVFLKEIAGFSIDCSRDMFSVGAQIALNGRMTC